MKKDELKKEELKTTIQEVINDGYNSIAYAIGLTREERIGWFLAICDGDERIPGYIPTGDILPIMRELVK